MKKLLLTLLTIVSLQLQAQCWKEISGGGFHTIAIKEDGTLWAWGRNNAGQLGDGTLENKNAPVQIGTDTDWVIISAGFQTNAAIKANGTLWAWGINYDGQIAGGPVYQNIPSQIGTDKDWKTVDCPGRHILAIKNNGTLWAWGYNTYGQLGLNSTTTIIDTPTQIGTANDWKEITGGSYFTLALKQNGTLWACGANEGGLGINTQELFVTVFTQIGTDNDWKTISAGYRHAFGIKNNGSLWAWGDNEYKQLGDNTSIHKFSPVSISTDNWMNVSADFSNNYGIKSDGTLWKWGTEEFSEDSEPINSLSVPTKVGEDTNWKQIQVVNNTSVFITKTNNDVLVWGDNPYGELGLGDNNAHPNQTVFGTICDSTANLQENTLSTISVYPNPTTNTLNLANANNLNIEKLTVIDVTGKTLLEQKSNTSQIDIQQLPAGMYFLEITTNSTKQYTKFIKE